MSLDLEKTKRYMETKKYRIVKKEYQDNSVKYTAERFDIFKQEWISIYTNADIDNVRGVIKEREARDALFTPVKEEVIE